MIRCFTAGALLALLAVFDLGGAACADEIVAQVIEAAGKKDEAGLRALAKRGSQGTAGDIWGLAARVARQDPAAADALARTVAPSDLEPLLEYLQRRRTHKRSPLVEAALRSRESGPAALTAIDAAIPLADAFDTARLIYRRAHLLRAAPEALGAWGRMVEASKKLGWLYGQSVGLLVGAAVAMQLGETERARRDTHAYVAVERKRGGNVAVATLNLGGFLVWSGALEDARRTLENLVADPDLPADLRADALQNLALVWRQLGHQQKALATLRSALALRDRNRDLLSWVELRFHVADAYDWMGDFEQALAVQTNALKVFEDRFSDRSDAAVVAIRAKHRTSIARTRLLLGEFEEALEGFEENLPLLGNASSERIVALSLCSDALHGLRRFDEACARADEALAAARKRREARLIVDVLANNLVRSHGAAGRFKQAETHAAEGIAAADELRLPKLQLEAYFRYAEVLSAQNKHAEALAACETAYEPMLARVLGLPEGVNATARTLHADVFRLAFRSAAARNEAATMFRWLERSRAGALLETMGNRDAIRKAHVDPELLTDEANARDEESQAHAALKRAREANQGQGSRKLAMAARARIRAAQHRVKEAVDAIQVTKLAATEILYPNPDELEVAQARLKAGQVLVAFALDKSQARALLVRRNDVKIVELGAMDAIRAAVEALSANMNRKGKPEHALKTLAELVVQPLKLTPSDKTVLISPDQALFAVPFAALMPKRRLAYIPSATTYGVLMKDAGERGQGVLGIGDPVYEPERGLSRLHSSGPELRAVVRGEPPLLREKATVASLRNAIAKRPRWRAVHFACHGECNVKQPLQSRLELSAGPDSDGQLTAEEVFQIDMPVDLAVLSACNTGTGTVLRGEGLIGLTRAFMLAGAPRVIATLWKVDDAATGALMKRFYELWHPKTGKGLETAQALKQAQAFVRSHKNGKWKSPYFWAGFVLWGLPD